MHGENLKLKYKLYFVECCHWFI